MHAVPSFLIILHLPPPILLKLGHLDYRFTSFQVSLICPRLVQASGEERHAEHSHEPTTTNGNGWCGSRRTKPGPPLERSEIKQVTAGTRAYRRRGSKLQRTGTGRRQRPPPPPQLTRAPPPRVPPHGICKASPPLVTSRHPPRPRAFIPHASAAPSPMMPSRSSSSPSPSLRDLRSHGSLSLPHPDTVPRRRDATRGGARRRC